MTHHFCDIRRLVAAPTIAKNVYIAKTFGTSHNARIELPDTGLKFNLTIKKILIY